MKLKKINLELLAKLALIAATVIWGSSFVIIKDVVEIMPPNYLMAIRFSVACILLSVVFWKRLKNISLSMVWQGAIIGLCLYLAYLTQTLGIMDTTPGKNAFLTSVYCVIVPFLFWAVRGKRPDKWNVVAAFVCLAGIAFLSLEGGFFIGKGDLLTLLGGFFFAAHMVAVSVLVYDKDPIAMTIFQFAFAAIFFWITTLSFERPIMPVPEAAIPSVIYMCVFCTAAALLLQNFGQKHTDPSVAAILLSFESVLGALFSLLMGKESNLLKTIVGFVLIFAAVIISETKLNFFKRKE